MKRLLFIISVMIMASSCFDDDMAQMKYTLIANFDNGAFDFKSDSTYLNYKGVGFNGC